MLVVLILTNSFFRLLTQMKSSLMVMRSLLIPWLARKAKAFESSSTE